MAVVAAPRGSLARHRLTAWIAAADVGADGTALPVGIARPVAVHVLEVVQVLGGDAAGRGIGVGREGQGHTVAPTSTDLGREQLRIDAVLVRLQEVLEADDVLLDHLEDAKAAVAPELGGAGQVVVSCVLREQEEPRLACLLVIRGHGFRAAEDPRRHRDAVGVAEVNPGDGCGRAVDHLGHERAVHGPQLVERVPLREELGQSTGMRRHHLGTRGVQGHHHVVVAGAESADPVLRPAVAVIADLGGPLRRPLDEGIEGAGWDRGKAIGNAQSRQARPRDADVQAVVGLPLGWRRRIVIRSWARHVPFVGRRDLWSVALVSGRESAQQRASRVGGLHLEQEVPHERHPIATEDDPLDVGQLQRAHPASSSVLDRPEGPERPEPVGRHSRSRRRGAPGRDPSPTGRRSPRSSRSASAAGSW